MMICHKTSVMRQRWDDRRQWSGRACPVMVWPDHRAVRGKPNWHACSATRNRLAAFADRPSRLPPPLSAVLSGEFSAARFVAAGNRRGFRLCYPDRPSLSQLFCRRRDRSWRQDRARTRARDQFRQRFAARVPWCSADRRRPVLGEVGSWLSSEILHGNAEHTGCARPGGGSDPPIDRVIAQNRSLYR